MAKIIACYACFVQLIDVWKNPLEKSNIAVTILANGQKQQQQKSQILGFI